MRTTKDVGHLFQPLEDAICTKFLPVITANYHFNELDRQIYSLPTKFGGLGIFNPVETCPLEFERSLKITRPPIDLIKEQC